MDLTPYLSAVAEDLDRATALADEATRSTAGRLAGAIEPALRLAMTQLLSDAAAQLTRDLPEAVITVRMDGREPVLQVQRTAGTEPGQGFAFEATAGDEAGTARVTVRLPEQLKRRAETLAQQADHSLNTWVVQTLRRATQGNPSTPHTSSGRVTGWA